MKIVHLVNTGYDNFGGKERIVLDLLEEMLKREVGVSLICLRDGIMQHEAATKGIPTKTMEPKWMLDPGIVLRLKSHLQREGVDLLHTHDFRENVIGRMAGKLAGIPVVTTLHAHAKDCLDLPYIKRWAFHSFDRATSPLSDHFIAITNEGYQWLCDHFGEKNATLIPNSIPADKFKHATQRGQREKPIIGSAGRLDKQKGFHILVEAAHRVLQDGLDMEFVLAGAGPKRNFLEAKISEFGIRDRFRLIGFIEDMPTFFAEIDVFVLPSLTEGLPVVLLEAMASSLPVVASKVGGIPDILEDGKNGIFVPPGNSSELASAIKRLAEDARLRDELGRNAFSTLQGRFSVGKMAGDTIAVYEKVLSKR